MAQYSVSDAWLTAGLVLVAGVLAALVAQVATVWMPHYAVPPPATDVETIGRKAARFAAGLSRDALFGGLTAAFVFPGVAYLTHNILSAAFCAGVAFFLPSGVASYRRFAKEAELQREIANCAVLVADLLRNSQPLAHCLYEASERSAGWIGAGLSAALAGATKGDSLKRHLEQWARETGRQDALLLTRLLAVADDRTKEARFTLRRFGDQVRRKSIMLEDLLSLLKYYYAAWCVFWALPLALFTVGMFRSPPVRQFFWGTWLGVTVSGAVFAASAATAAGLALMSRP